MLAGVGLVQPPPIPPTVAPWSQIMNRMCPAGLLLSALSIAILLTTGCAGKAQTSDSKPGMFSSVKKFILPKNDDIPQAAIAPVAGDLQGFSFGTAMGNSDFIQLNSALETGHSHQAVSWVNQSTGHQYTVTPYPVFQDTKGRYCRELTVDSLIKGRQESVRTLACRPASGLWNVQG